MISSGGLKDKNLIENSAFEKSLRGAPRMPRIPANGVTGRRTEPGKHAHAFRMTLVGRDKLPQTNDEATEKQRISKGTNAKHKA